MFQIETALLKFDGVSDSQGENSNKTSVVKRLEIINQAQTC